MMYIVISLLESLSKGIETCCLENHVSSRFEIQVEKETFLLVTIYNQEKAIYIYKEIPEGVLNEEVDQVLTWCEETVLDIKKDITRFFAWSRV